MPIFCCILALLILAALLVGLLFALGILGDRNMRTTGVLTDELEDKGFALIDGAVYSPHVINR